MPIAIGLVVVLVFLRGVLQRALGVVWEDIWTVILNKVAEAEEHLKGAPGTEKRKAVVEGVQKWVLDRAPQLSWLQRTLLNYAVGVIVDSFISELNEELGHDWLEKAKEFKDRLALGWGLVKEEA